MAKPAAPLSPDIEISNKLSLAHAAVLMAALIGFSRLTGFARMMLVSHLYATGPEAAVFEAAFNIPDTVTIIIAGGALSTGFVPVFTQYLARGEQEQARRTFRAMWTLLSAAFGLITIVLLAMTFTSWASRLAPVAVGPEYVPLYFKLLRILLISQFFFVVGGLFSGTLNALRQFWYPALQPVIFNLGIIAFGIVLPLCFGMGIESQAWGALAGAIVGSLLMQLPAVRRSGLSLKPLWDVHDPGVRRVMRNLLPIVFGLASGQIIALNLPRFVAYGLPVTELPSIGYANRLMQLPLAVLASGPAIALFPTLALLYAERRTDAMREQLAVALRRTVALMALATALMAALRFPIVHFLLEHGDFTKVDSLHVAPVLGCYSLCVVGLGAQQVLARGFYAMEEVVTPILVGIGGIILFFALAAVIDVPRSSGAVGLALAAAVTVSVMAYLMWVSLKGKLRGWDNGKTNQTLWQSAVAAAAAYYVALLVARVCLNALTSAHMDDIATPGLVKFGGRGMVLLLGTCAGTLAFLLTGAVVGLREIDFVWRKFSRRKSIFVTAALKHEKVNTTTPESNIK